MPFADPAIMWTVPEVVAHWKISRSTVYRLMEDGELAYVQMGRRRLVPSRALQAVFESRLNASADQKEKLSDTPPVDDAGRGGPGGWSR